MLWCFYLAPLTQTFCACIGFDIVIVMNIFNFGEKKEPKKNSGETSDMTPYGTSGTHLVDDSTDSASCDSSSDGGSSDGGCGGGE